MSQLKPVDIPIGRVELLGQVLHIVEHEGRLVAACNDEHGLPFEALCSQRLDGRGCRDLMRQAVDLLIEAADLSLILSAFAAKRASLGHARPRRNGDVVGEKHRSPDQTTIALSVVRPR